ncbi:hypothetical protein B0H19DRAFT_1145176 [Mycena capillaripes]|nr:hypothetical protein B0H19DRAFT_1145176 [Mycena capillaripes]
MEKLQIDVKAYWSDLPADIIMAIIRFLAPYEIIILRKVSKSLSDVTRERSHAATACRRFSSRLRKEFSENRTVWPHSIRSLEPPHMGQEFEHMRFLPGGRFLLTTDKTTLQLWDLGGHDTPPTRDPIASLEIEGVTDIESLRTRGSHSSSDALVIVSTTESDSFFRIHIFNIFPPTSPHFRSLAPILVLPIDEHCPSILGATSRHVAIATEFSTVLWDFIDDTWVSWPRDPTEFDDTFYLCNNNIVILRADEAKVCIASVPALHPRFISDCPPEIDSLHILEKYPLRRFNQSETLEFCVGGITLVFHGRERSTVDQPIYIDILSTVIGKAMLTHFALVPSPNTSGGQVETATHCALVPLGESSLDAAFRSSHSLHLEWLRRGSIQSFVVESSTLHVCLSDMDGATSASLAGILATPGLPVNEVNVDFCSFSGRVCARVPMANGEGFKVLVMDYVLPQKQP